VSEILVVESQLSDFPWVNVHPCFIDRHVRLVEPGNHCDWWWLWEQDGKRLANAALASAHPDPELQ